MKKQPSLLLCIVMDALGCITYLLPAIGEFGDFVWAPVSGFIFYKAFGGRVGVLGGIFNFIEEALPGLDFIPTFTIAWIWQYINRKNVLNEK
jgi:hypothetical protein